MSQKIILFYKFTPVKSPHDVRKWQTVIAAERGLNGRIIVSDHGINSTLGGDAEALEDYIEKMEETELADFSGIEYKWSDGRYEDFPKLSVKVRDELVTLAPEEEFDVYDQGTALRPEDWHKFIEENPDTVILDARNNYESKVGRFKNALTPNINSFKEIKPELEKLDKKQPVLTYCTGDIRCEYLSAYMKHKGFKDVYHLDGGIVKYGEKFADSGKWEGSCYVFDKRMAVNFSDSTKQIGSCYFCQSHTNNYTNCSNTKCNRLMIVCEDCKVQKTCSSKCQLVIG